MNLYSFINVLSYPIGIVIMMIVLYKKGNDDGLSYKDILPLLIIMTLLIFICSLYIAVTMFNAKYIIIER